MGDAYTLPDRWFKSLTVEASAFLVVFGRMLGMARKEEVDEAVPSTVTADTSNDSRVYNLERAMEALLCLMETSQRSPVGPEDAAKIREILNPAPSYTGI